jgi:ABC-type branched-subunit amino acid transport system substrate-binding protein
VLVLAIFGAACSSSKSKSAATGGTTPAAATTVPCTGEPLKFGAIVAETVSATALGTTVFLDVGPGAEAAAHALTASCALGRPVQAVVCDSQNDPNTATACGRKMVDEKVVAFIGADAFGAQWFPLTSKAGIPEVGGLGFSANEAPSPLFFPIGASVHDTLTVSTVAASASGSAAPKLAVVPADLPGIDFFVNFLKQTVQGLGGSLAGSFPAAAGTTDMSAVAAQVARSGANSVHAILAGDQVVSLVKALDQQGKKLTDLNFITIGSVASPKFLKDVGSAGEGMWISSEVWPVQYDANNDGAKQYLADMTAAGQPASGDKVGNLGLQTWSVLQVIATLLKGEATMDPATLVKKMNAAGPISRPEFGTINWTTNPFASDPILKNLRIASDNFVVSRIVNGKPVVVSNGFAKIGQKFTPKS